MTNVSRPLRAGLAAAAALALAAAAAAGSALPASALELTSAARTPSAAEWWLPALGVPAAWRAAPGAGQGVTVAVLSTGVDGSHPDLTGTVTTGPNFAQTGRGPGQAFWADEGTAVAGLIAGHGHGSGGSDGVTGIAPGARILSVQVTLEYNDPLDTDAAVTGRLPAAIAAGIRYAVAHGAAVISLPLDPGMMGARGGAAAATGGSQAERAAVAYAISRNVLLVAPAGDNDGGNAVNYPAGYPGVIVVGATAQGRGARAVHQHRVVRRADRARRGRPVGRDRLRRDRGPARRPDGPRPGRRVPDPGLDRHGVRADGRRRRAHPRSLPVAHGGRGHPGDRGRRDRPRSRPGRFDRDEFSRRGRVGSRRAQRRKRARPGGRDRGRSPATHAVGVGVGPGCPADRPRAGARAPGRGRQAGQPRPGAPLGPRRRARRRLRGYRGPDLRAGGDLGSPPAAVRAGRRRGPRRPRPQPRTALARPAAGRRPSRGRPIPAGPAPRRAPPSARAAPG